RLPFLTKNLIEKCEKEFGWAKSIILKFGIRLYYDSTGKQKIAIPIRDGKNRLLNIRLYQPGATRNKVISWSEGEGKEKKTYGEARLFPAPEFWGEGTIFLCEGEKDTLCAISHGLNAVTQSAGCNTWKDEFNIFFKDRDVVICYDHDKKGQAGAVMVAKKLVSVARSVKILQWPDYMGNPIPENHGEDLTDFFIKHKKNISDFNELVALAKNIEKTIEEDTGYLQYFRDSGNGRKKFSPALLADAILKNIEIIADPKTGKIYKWNGKYWQEWYLDKIEALALNMLGIEAQADRAKTVARQIYLKSLIPDDRELNDQHHLLCLRNGMLNLNTLQLEPHKKEHFSTIMLDYDYDPDAECPTWINFLQEVIPDGNARIQLQQFFGYCLTRETRYAKALILVGPGQDGKSTILNVLRNLIGEKNCSAVPMSELNEPFQRATLYNKLLNTSTEEDRKIFGSAMFKAIVTGDYINASYKHRDFFEFKPFCKLAFATNFMPQVSDFSHGFYRRILGIKFTKQFLGKDDDKFLLDKLLKEISGIFNWALQGLLFLREYNDFIESETSENFLKEYKKFNNPVLAFIEDCCEVAEGNQDEYRVPTKEAYLAYTQYCRLFGYMPMHQQNFGMALRNVIKNLKVGKMWDHKTRAYIGFRLLPEEERGSK
ncbi:MAG: phage/plasmid primase, P4 family, partial [Candidatus Bilamarchaeaceae archaeon]